MRLFLSTFAVTFLAEIPDKTAFAAMFLSSRYGPFPVLAGACLAFVIQSAIAVSFGTFIGRIPRRAVEGMAALVFLVMAFLMARKRAEPELEPTKAGREGFWRGFNAAFMTIFAAEWGDMTQVSTGALCARYGHPAVIFWAATLALWSASGLTVAFGHHFGRRFDPRALEVCAAVVFGALGLGLAVHALL